MIYIGLDFDSRYLGKEIVGAFGTKLGKSIISLLLSLLPYYLGNISEFSLRIMSVVTAIGWLFSALSLSSFAHSEKTKQKILWMTKRSSTLNIFPIILLLRMIGHMYDMSIHQGRIGSGLPKSVIISKDRISIRL